ncbi:hypothetical protein NPIL_148831 [Nephila pilipes]|uniref:Uncharacterized protein n=1 Tax=Nephila pilipes TaxID=299642 RepID=A0A8X6Q198_NEPPI|nr:hypothetical protein NPIL_148831 [Nephila pilipes]
MAYLARDNKLDLLEICEGIGVEVNPSSKVAEIKKLILNSQLYVEEEVKIILDRVIRDRKEQERIARESKQHEIEMKNLELSQKNQSLNANNSRGDSHRNETHFNSRPNSNHGPFCKVEGKMFNESLHEYQCENIFVNDKIVKTLIDLGANIVCVKSSLIPPETKSFGTVQLTCAFGNEIQTQLTKIKLALSSFRENPIIVTAAICNNLYWDLIVPPNIFDDLYKAEKKMLGFQKKNPISSHSKKNFSSSKNKNDRQNNFASESVSKNKSSFKNCIYHEEMKSYPTIPNHSGDGSRPNDSTQFQNIDNASNEKTQ